MAGIHWHDNTACTDHIFHHCNILQGSFSLIQDISTEACLYFWQFMGSAGNAGEDMPADDACKLMMADVNQALMSATIYMCQQSVDVCMHVYTALNEAGMSATLQYHNMLPSRADRGRVSCSAVFQILCAQLTCCNRGGIEGIGLCEHMEMTVSLPAMCMTACTGYQHMHACTQ